MIYKSAYLELRMRFFNALIVVVRANFEKICYWLGFCLCEFKDINLPILSFKKINKSLLICNEAGEYKF